MAVEVKINRGFSIFVMLGMILSGIIGLPPIISSISASSLPLNSNFYQAFSETSGASAQSQRPNFLVILGDDFGYADIGSFGSEISTPNLDTLAKEGKVLTNYHTAPTCSPARLSLLTGVDWHIGGIGTMYELIAENQVGQPGYETYINDRVVTVAELLRDAGYNTMLSGKWHLSGSGKEGQPGTKPYDRGFENVFTLLQDGANHFNNNTYVPGYTVTFVENDTVVPRPGNNTVYAADLYTDKILEYLKKTEADDKPFFAYLSFQVAHTPFQAPPDNIEKYYKIYRSIGWDKIREQIFEKQKQLGIWPSNMTIPQRLPPNQSWESLTNDQKDYAAKVLAVHAAMIGDMDKNVGRVIQYLKDTGQYDNTLILFTSDNGTSEPVELAKFKYSSAYNATQAAQFIAGINNSFSNLGNADSDFNYGSWGTYVAVAPFSGFKGSFYEGGTRVPFLIKEPLPTSNATNNIIKSFVYVTDITPTILDFADVSYPTTYQGRDIHPPMGKSFKAVLNGTAQNVYADNEPVPAELFNQTTVIMGDWKGIHDSSDKPNEWKLYDLAVDLGESINVADLHPDIVQTMKEVYGKFAEDVGVIIPRGAQFATAVANVFPELNSTNIQTISLSGMLAPGFKGQIEPIHTIN